jgi:hypothetical protein
MATDRDDAPAPSSPPESRSTNAVDEAAALLHVAPDASPIDVRRAFRQALRDQHPDHGGDHSTTRALIDARDLLMDRPLDRAPEPNEGEWVVPPPPRRPREFTQRRRHFWER